MMSAGIQNLSTNDTNYLTRQYQPSWFFSAFPSLCFYAGFLRIVWKAGRRAKRNNYDMVAWQASSIDVLHRLEQVGVQLEVSGLEHVNAERRPTVFIGNHLSVMETVLLPSILLPYSPVTYVIKQSLLEVPVFRHVMRSCSPIAVTRTNPRHDLKIVLEEGIKRLENGISIIIFPQTTRAPFNPEQFSSIGVKLAKKAGVPIIPLALLTDAWGNGRWLKDFGWIRPSRLVRFSFGPSMMVTGKGVDEHQAVIDFIEQNLARWYKEDQERETSSKS